MTKRKYQLKDLTEDFPLFIQNTSTRDHVLHSHDFTELVIVEYGKGIHFTSNYRHMVATGDVLVIPKGMKHGYEDSEKFRITNVIFDLSLLDSLPETFKYIPGFQSLFLLNPFQRKKAVNRKCFLTLEPEQIDHVKQLTGRMTHELREKRIGYQAVCTLTLADLIIFLSRLASKHNLSMHTNKVAEALSYMEKNYANHISLGQLSRAAKLSPRNFQQIFKDYLGISPFRHLIKIRLQNARKLLLETDLSIGEIAYAAGFGDSAYFARQFKKVLRTSPSDYRKEALSIDQHERTYTKTSQ
ncbi:MAG: helix-turn-helix domain-containing protein [Victivallales bacterium]